MTLVAPPAPGVLAVVQRPVAAGNWRKGHEPPRKVTACVLHVTEGTAASVDAWFANAAAMVSAHFMVTLTGAVRQYVGIHDIAFANGRVHRPTWTGLTPGNPNDYTVSIEHEGTGRDPWPPAQLQASARLAAWLCDRFQWEPTPERFPLHREIYALKTCPGPAFDRDDYLARVRAARRLYAPDARAFVTGIR